MNTTITKTVTVERVATNRYVTVAKLGRDTAIVSTGGSKGTTYVNALKSAVAYAERYNIAAVQTPFAVLKELPVRQAAEIAGQMRASDERHATRSRRRLAQIA